MTQISGRFRPLVPAALCAILLSLASLLLPALGTRR